MVIETTLCVVVNLAMIAPRTVEAAVRGELQAYGVRPKQEQIWRTVKCPGPERKEEEVAGAEDMGESTVNMPGGSPTVPDPFGVSMGDPINPDEGWTPHGLGLVTREYKGALGGFDHLVTTGTREGGACQVGAATIKDGSIESYNDLRKHYDDMRKLLIHKHGEPEWESGDEPPLPGDTNIRVSTWVLSENPAGVGSIELKHLGGVDSSYWYAVIYYFRNYQECLNVMEDDMFRPPIEYPEGQSGGLKGGSQ